jgi:hypothetical protein
MDNNITIPERYKIELAEHLAKEFVQTQNITTMTGTNINGSNIQITFNINAGEIVNSFNGGKQAFQTPIMENNTDEKFYETLIKKQSEQISKLISIISNLTNKKFHYDDI